MNEALLIDLLNRRPAMNAGLIEAYAHWNDEVYRVMGALSTTAANEPTGDYPALPDAAGVMVEHVPVGEGWVRHYQSASYTADQMRAYIDADRAMRAAQPAGAQQPGTAYAELPSYEHQRAIMEAERNASLDEYSRIVPLTSTESMIYERAFTNGWNRHASHGQAPAQAAPAAVAGPKPGERCQHCIDLRDGFYGSYAPPCPYHDDDGKPRVAAPTAQPAPQHQARINGDSAAPKLRAMATNYTAGHQWDKLDAQACIRGALEIEALRAARAPADSVLEDAARLDFIERHPEMSLRHHKGRWAFLGFTNYEYDLHQSLRGAIDAAMAAQGGK